MVKYFLALLFFWAPPVLALLMLPNNPDSAASFFVLWLVINVLFLPWKTILFPPPFNHDYFEAPLEVIEESDMPEKYIKTLWKLSEPVLDLGFEHFLWIRFEMNKGDRSFLRVMRMPDRFTVCTNAVSRSAVVPKSAPPVTETAYTSRIDSNRSIVTTNFLVYIDLGANQINLAIPGAMADALLDIHRARFADRRQRPVAFPESPEEYLELFRRDLQANRHNFQGYVMHDGEPVRLKRTTILGHVLSARLGLAFIKMLRDRLRTRAELRRLGFGRLA